MKTTTKYLGFILLLTSQAGCSPDYEIPDNLHPSLNGHFLAVTENSFTSSASAFNRVFKVGSFETAWKFNAPAAWLSVAPMSGKTTAEISLSGEENKSATEGRTSIFYLNSDDRDWPYEKTITVSQEKATSHLTPDRQTIEFGGSGGTETVSIESNCEWTAQTEDAWITVSQDMATNTLTIQAESNPLDNYRKSDIRILYGNDEQTGINIIQSPSAIASSVYHLEYDALASRYTVIIDSETEWKAVESDSWIQVNPPTGGTGRTAADVEVSSNMSVSERRGFICLQTGDTERFQISITQKGIHFEVSEETLAFKSGQDAKKLTVDSNFNWNVLTKPNWITLSNLSGYGNEEITVTTKENNSTSAREGNITIGIPEMGLTRTIQVTQEGKTFETSSDFIEFSDKGGYRNFSLTTDSDWTSSILGNWFSASPEYGHGDAMIEIRAEENPTTEERNGSITYSYSGDTKTVAVHQLAKYLTISNEALTFESKGGNHSVEISTNYNWTAAIEHDENWLHLSETSGQGNGTIILTADDNASINVRSTAIVVTPENAQPIRLLVTQNPRYLTVSHQSLEFFSKGGRSEGITIKTDGQYELSTEAPWLELSDPINGVFTVTATENKSDRNREGTITITMTDLAEGSHMVKIRVTQTGAGKSIITDGYPDTDTDWNSWSNGNLTITITGYTSDRDWNRHGTPMSVTITGYNSDHDWNKNDPSNSHMTIFNHGADENWNPENTDNGNPSVSDYGEDKDWNENS